MFNAINFEETTRMSAKHVDIPPISRKAEDDLDLIAGDGLHPSGKMYSEWVEIIYPVASEIIQNNTSHK